MLWQKQTLSSCKSFCGQTIKFLKNYRVGTPKCFLLTVLVPDVNRRVDRAIGIKSHGWTGVVDRHTYQRVVCDNLDAVPTYCHVLDHVVRHLVDAAVDRNLETIHNRAARRWRHRLVGPMSKSLSRHFRRDVCVRACECDATFYFEE